MYKIFYGDGEVTEDEVRLPARDVQIILQDDKEVGIATISGADYYILKDGEWRGVDIFGLFDFLMDTGIVLFGRTMKREEYNKIVRMACEDKKNGWLPFEVGKSR